MVELIPPRTEYRESYLDALREFHAENRNLHIDYEFARRDFDAFVRDLLARRDQLLPGRVPESVFWLVEENTYIGRLALRHSLNHSLRQIGGHIGYEIRPTQRRRGYGTLILKLGLREAAAIGLERALVTCDEDNIGSARIIEANGGVLNDTVVIEGHRAPVRRYWIELKTER
jgi:predicted acetyltransferase